jgi:hypothetical protein
LSRFEAAGASAPERATAPNRSANAVVERRVRLASLDVVAIGGLLVAAVVLPLAVGAVSGVLDVPRNDDWSYRGIAMRLFTTGRLELDGAVQAASLGLALTVQPLLWLSGGEWWAFLVAGIVFDAVAIGAGYLLLRRILPPPLAALGVGLVVIFPAWLPYSLSFMSDVPGLAAQLTCLYLGAVALDRPRSSGRWLAAALIVGLYGYSIREFALAAPAAVLLAALIREPRRASIWVGAAVAAAVVIGLYFGRSLLPGVAGQFGPEAVARLRIVPALCTLGLVLAPATMLAVGTWWGRWQGRDFAIGAALVAGLIAVQLALLASSPEDRRLLGGSFPYVLLYDLISQWGAPAADYLIGRRPLLIHTPVWIGVGAVAIGGAVLLGGAISGLAGAAWRWLRAHPGAARTSLGSPMGLLAIYATGSVAGLVAYGTTWTLFDRYLWPLVPALAGLLLYRPTPMGLPRRRSLAIVAVSAAHIALLAGLSLVFLFNADAFDAARWRAGEALVARGYEARSVDAGPEWVGSHPTGLAQAASPLPNSLTWWQSWWPEFRMCAFVASAPRGDPRYELLETRREAYRLYLFFGDWKPLYLYAVRDAGCPPPAAAGALRP